MNVRFLAPMLIALAAAGGCSKGVSLKTVAVSGKVTLNNQPLAGATVTFLPDVPVGSTALPAPSTGVTGADGSYKLSTMASGRQVVEGVPPGSFKVIIAKQQTSAPANPNPMAALEGLSDEERAKKVQSMSPDELAKMGGAPARAGEASGAAKSEVPDRYGKPDESGLTATVKDGGAQTFDFPLTSP